MPYNKEGKFKYLFLTVLEVVDLLTLETKPLEESTLVGKILEVKSKGPFLLH